MARNKSFNNFSYKNHWLLLASFRWKRKSCWVFVSYQREMHDGWWLVAASARLYMWLLSLLRTDWLRVEGGRCSTTHGAQSQTFPLPALPHKGHRALQCSDSGSAHYLPCSKDVWQVHWDSCKCVLTQTGSNSPASEIVISTPLNKRQGHCLPSLYSTDTHISGQNEWSRLRTMQLWLPGWYMCVDVEMCCVSCPTRGVGVG